MLLAALIVAALPAFDGDPNLVAAARAPAPDPVLVLRVHSLAGLVESHGREGAAMRFLPYAASNDDSFPDVSGESGPCVLAAEDVCALVREMIAPAFWEETSGASIDLRGPARMFVVATPEIQDAIADFLSKLVGTLVPTEVLEVRVLPSDAADMAGSDASLDVAEADRRIAARKLQRRAAAALRGRAVVSGDDVERESIIYDYEVEIAQGATIADPVEKSVAVGLEMAARSTRVEGGTLLNLVARASDRAAPMVRRRTGATSLVNAKSAMTERVAAGVFEHPEISFATFAGTVFVPEGRAIWVPVTVATHLGPVRVCLDLRVTGRLAPMHASIEPQQHSEGETMRFDLLSRGAADFGRVGIDRLSPEVFNDGWAVQGGAPIWARVTLPEEEGVLLQLVHTIASEALDGGQGSTGYAGDYVRTWLPRSFADKVAAALAPMQKFDATLQVRGRLLQDGEERAAFRLPVVLGQPVALWAGVEGTRLLDWDVDVANEVQACNPTPEAWIDGFGLRLEIARSASGDLVLDASGKVCLLQGPPQPIELQDDSRLTIDKIRSRSLFIDELRTLPAQGGKALFGGSLALELEVLAGAR